MTIESGLMEVKLQSIKRASINETQMKTLSYLFVQHPHIRRHVKHFEGLVPCPNLVHLRCKENLHRTYESRVKEHMRAMEREHLGK